MVQQRLMIVAVFVVISKILFLPHDLRAELTRLCSGHEFATYSGRTSMVDPLHVTLSLNK